jgi:hypothetical protein
MFFIFLIQSAFIKRNDLLSERAFFSLKMEIETVKGAICALLGSTFIMIVVSKLLKPQAIPCTPITNIPYDL